MRPVCFMVMVLFASVVVLPSESLPLTNQSNHLVQRTLNDVSEASQTHRSSHPPMSQAPPTLHPSTLRSIRTATAVPVVVQSSNHSRHLLIQISPSSTPVSSSKTVTAKTTSTAPNKVEEFAKKLRADMESSERVLNVFIKTIKDKHASTQSKLKQVKSILKGLKDEINNATKYANAYQSQDTDLTKQDTLYKTEYDKSYKMYLQEQANIKFEKQFLEEIIKYIQLRKTQKC